MSLGEHKPQRLRQFVQDFAQLMATKPAESELLDQGSSLLADLVAVDDWLPEAYAIASPIRYRQYLLYTDVREDFSVVSFVWAPGQETPIHDHTVWGLIGQLRGKESSQAYVRDEAGRLQAHGSPLMLRAGDVTAVSPTVGDVHSVRNASGEVSISIHVYGANIGAVERSTYNLRGELKAFISGYSNASMPNLWDRSADLQHRAAP
jgi:predicted metal-dependent enzyme (double-stranded beta helix superfamily)